MSATRSASLLASCLLLLPLACDRGASEVQHERGGLESQLGPAPSCPPCPACEDAEDPSAAQAKAPAEPTAHTDDPAEAPAYRGPEDTQVLAEIAAAVDRTLEAGETPVVVFDLDHTLFDNRPRTFQILQGFAASLEPEQREQAERLRAMPMTAIDYLLEDTFKHAGVDAALLERATAFWVPRFFSDEYTVLDVPYTSAPDYVGALHERGAVVVYLTGRDAPRMAEGTRASLERWDFPLDADTTRRILKPSKDEEDLDFKREAFAEIDALGSVVAAFENEPGNLAAMAERWPEATPVFLMTDFNPKRALPLPDRVRKIRDYGSWSEG